MFVNLSAYPSVIVRLQLSKNILTTRKNCWRCCFLCNPCCIKGKYVISISQNFSLLQFYIKFVINKNFHVKRILTKFPEILQVADNVGLNLVF